MVEVEADKLKKKLDSETSKSKDVKITLTDLLIKITATVLSEFPRFNAALLNEKGKLVLRIYKQVNIGVAVSTERGLFVPVVKDVGNKSLVEVAKQTKQLSAKAKANKLSPEELSGGSFTISNLGMYGVQSFIPIINPPEIAILGIGSIQEKTVPVMSVCLGMDHRAVDGADGAKFLQKLKDLIENPTVTIQ
jgi:pyruvate dehydrogenase E2 component (dihydrolipoamide acetyltransferase)